MKISIIGPMAAGKTTIGRLLAQKYKLPFYDTDQLIEAKAGMSVNDIFMRFGEMHFRKLETEVLRTLLAEAQDMMIATGGGIVKEEVNRHLLKTHTKVLFLDIPVSLQLQRTQGDTTRPLLLCANKEERLEKLACERRPLYQALADQCIFVDEKTEAEIIALFSLLD